MGMCHNIPCPIPLKPCMNVHVALSLTATSAVPRHRPSHHALMEQQQPDAHLCVRLQIREQMMEARTWLQQNDNQAHHQAAPSSSRQQQPPAGHPRPPPAAAPAATAGTAHLGMVQASRESSGSPVAMTRRVGENDARPHRSSPFGGAPVAAIQQPSPASSVTTGLPAWLLANLPGASQPGSAPNPPIPPPPSISPGGQPQTAGRPTMDPSSSAPFPPFFPLAAAAATGGPAPTSGRVAASSPALQLPGSTPMPAAAESNPFAAMGSHPQQMGVMPAVSPFGAWPSGLPPPAPPAAAGQTPNAPGSLPAQSRAPTSQPGAASATFNPFLASNPFLPPVVPSRVGTISDPIHPQGSSLSLSLFCEWIGTLDVDGHCPLHYRTIGQAEILTVNAPCELPGSVQMENLCLWAQPRP